MTLRYSPDMHDVAVIGGGPGGLQAARLLAGAGHDVAVFEEHEMTGDPERDPPPLVRPIVNAECSRCHWWEHCRPQLNPEDVSLRIDKGALDSREIVTLRRHGIDTVTDLAGVDLDSLLTWYLPEVTHRSGAELRIRNAARRARMLLDGRWFDRESSGPIEVNFMYTSL